MHKIAYRVQKGVDVQVITGITDTQKSLIMAGIYNNVKKPVCILTYNNQEADRIYNDLVSFLPEDKVLIFPALEVLAHEEIIPSTDVLSSRARVLEAIYKKEEAVIVIPVRAVLEKMIPAENYFLSVLNLNLGSNIQLQELAKGFSRMGYEKTDIIDEKGQFSIRGGIVDCFPINMEEPVRIEFFDDEIDSIRCFDISDQRSKESINNVFFFPVNEGLIEEDFKLKGIKKIESEVLEVEKKLGKSDRFEEAEKLRDKISEHIEKLKEGIIFEGIHGYKPFFYDELDSILDYLWDECLLILDEHQRLKEYVRNAFEEMGERHMTLLERGEILPSQFEAYMEAEELLEDVEKRQRVYTFLLSENIKGVLGKHILPIESSKAQSFYGKMDLVIDKIKEWKNKGKRILISLATVERVKRLSDELSEHNIQAVSIKSLNDKVMPRSVLLINSILRSGFQIEKLGLIVLTDVEIFGKKAGKIQKKKSKAIPKTSNYMEFKVGDLVVHENHGIGQYQGIESMNIGEIKKDFLVVKYSGDDKLYVPAEQANLLQKYIGADEDIPKLYKLGGNEWTRIKKRVKQSVQELAEDLLELYAARERAKGHAFAKDTIWQQEFEDAFKYEETPDQYSALDEIKRDMEIDKPMDRLLCGDVGYGKTEVAVRAAFKANMDNMQVAVLVPTTILAQQHYNTFSERFNNYPVTIKALSRFQSPKEQREILKGLYNGSVDVVIGTHRLLQKDIEFKNLGLIIVDEEQRFGVAQKERLKTLKKSTDVLTLTATPIPRTLHMSLISVRDMSVIETPPEDRFPIRTYVIRHNDDLVKEAINRELQRDGQIYYVHNRVQNIHKVAARIQKLVPDARIGIAHGQMREDRLERVMLQFLNKEYDILVCTTIIENGLDIANVNTILVIDADKMGLSQLYQLRGRVGRTNRVAYAYFMYHPEKILSEDAEKRLQALKEFSSLGSGFKVAMRDLEIRGAGNILGPEQHGHIAAVGFEMYRKLLQDAINSLNGGEKEETVEPTVELNVSAYISDRYIGDPRQKIEIYKKVVGISNLQQAEEVQEEILDRFGKMPVSVKNLLTIARIKVLAKELSITSVTMDKGSVILKLIPGMEHLRGKIREAPAIYRKSMQYVAGRIPHIRISLSSSIAGKHATLVEGCLRSLRDQKIKATG